MSKLKRQATNQSQELEIIDEENESNQESLAIVTAQLQMSDELELRASKSTVPIID